MASGINKSQMKYKTHGGILHTKQNVGYIQTNREEMDSKAHD